ncbi:hypothetical protein TNCV_1539691 [Trichonephila clavipes]|nr:hypothetical protein TNCV_1539691 [Trichonephila clavipes]
MSESRWRPLARCRLLMSVTELPNIRRTDVTSKNKRHQRGSFNFGNRSMSQRFMSAKMLQTSRRGRGQQDDSKYIGNAGSEMLS